MEWHPRAAGKISGALTALACLAPWFIIGYLSPTMNKLETVVLCSLVSGGFMIGFFIGSRRPRVGFIGLPLAAFAVSFITVFTFYSIREAKLSALRARLSDYTALNLRPLDKSKGEHLRVRRKFVAIDQDKKEIDPLQIVLPDDLRASVPGEVRTVLYLKWGEEEVGKYANGGLAIRRLCDLTIIDFGDVPAPFATKRILGDDPPDHISGNNSSSKIYGRPPYAQIIDYLRSLPGQ
jgi:hypothetical protein